MPQPERQRTMPDWQTSSSATSKPLPLPRKWVDALFLKMMAIYTHRWSSCYPNDEVLEVAKGEWSEALAGLDGEAIKRGITRCRADLEWPPNPAQFLRLARPAPPPATQQYFQALPAPAPHPEVVKAAVGRMQQARSGGKGGRRCIYSPGYGPDEYAAAIRAAKAEGRRLYDVDMTAMARNGWTEEDESRIRANMLNTGIPLSTLYAKGHEPGAEP